MKPYSLLKTSFVVVNVSMLVSVCMIDLPCIIVFFLLI